MAEQLASTAKYGWTPLHAAARGNAEAMGAVMTSLVNYMEADEVCASVCCLMVLVLLVLIVLVVLVVLVVVVGLVLPGMMFFHPGYYEDADRRTMEVDTTYCMSEPGCALCLLREEAALALETLH